MKDECSQSANDRLLHLADGTCAHPERLKYVNEIYAIVALAGSRGITSRWWSTHTDMHELKRDRFGACGIDQLPDGGVVALLRVRCLHDNIRTALDEAEYETAYHATCVTAPISCNNPGR